MRSITRLSGWWPAAHAFDTQYADLVLGMHSEEHGAVAVVWHVELRFCCKGIKYFLAVEAGQGFSRVYAWRPLHHSQGEAMDGVQEVWHIPQAAEQKHIYV